MSLLDDQSGQVDWDPGKVRNWRCTTNLAGHNLPATNAAQIEEVNLEKGL